MFLDYSGEKIGGVGCGWSAQVHNELRDLDTYIESALAGQRGLDAIQTFSWIGMSGL